MMQHDRHLAERCAYHEAGHTVVAMVLGWSLGDVSLQKTQLRPNYRADERAINGDFATICLAGEALKKAGCILVE